MAGTCVLVLREAICEFFLISLFDFPAPRMPSEPPPPPATVFFANIDSSFESPHKGGARGLYIRIVTFVDLSILEHFNFIFFSNSFVYVIEQLEYLSYLLEGFFTITMYLYMLLGNFN